MGSLPDFGSDARAAWFSLGPATWFDPEAGDSRVPLAAPTPRQTVYTHGNTTFGLSQTDLKSSTRKETRLILPPPVLGHGEPRSDRKHAHSDHDGRQEREAPATGDDSKQERSDRAPDEACARGSGVRVSDLVVRVWASLADLPVPTRRETTEPLREGGTRAPIAARTLGVTGPRKKPTSARATARAAHSALALPETAQQRGGEKSRAPLTSIDDKAPDVQDGQDGTRRREHEDRKRLFAQPVRQRPREDDATGRDPAPQAGQDVPRRGGGGVALREEERDAPGREDVGRGEAADGRRSISCVFGIPNMLHERNSRKDDEDDADPDGPDPERALHPLLRRHLGPRVDDLALRGRIRMLVHD